MQLSLYPRMLCHVFWSQVEYKIVCFIYSSEDNWNNLLSTLGFFKDVLAILTAYMETRL